MSVVIVKRPPRALPPDIPGEELTLEAPPELPREGEDNMLMNLMPMMGMAGSAGFLFMGTQPFMKIMGGVMVVSTLAMAIVQIVKARQGPSGQMLQERRITSNTWRRSERKCGAPHANSVTRSFSCTPIRGNCGRSSPKANGCGNGGLPTPTSHKYGWDSARSNWPLP